MNALDENLGSGSPLLTDLYQLTMAYGYWKSGVPEKEAVFHLFFRKSPFASGFTIACGLADAIEFLSTLEFARRRVELSQHAHGQRRAATF